MKLFYKVKDLNSGQLDFCSLGRKFNIFKKQGKLEMIEPSEDICGSQVLFSKDIIFKIYNL